jgi:enoyl-CoA hydratase/carnithine racemase
MSEERPSVLVERDGAVGTIILNRPERVNAWNTALEEGMINALRELEADEDIRAVILTGAGQAFSSGIDLKDPNTHHVTDVEEALNRRLKSRTAGSNIFDMLSGFKKPIVAAVNGHAIGFGCLIALCCDFVYIAESAQFQLPQVALGIIPAYGGALRVVRAVGNINAAEMILTGRAIDAQTAARWGMAAEVLPDDELLPHAKRMMQVVAGHSPAAIALTRESLKTAIETNNMESAKLSDLHRSLLLSASSETSRRHEAWRQARAQRKREEEQQEGSR